MPGPVGPAGAASLPSFPRPLPHPDSHLLTFSPQPDASLATFPHPLAQCFQVIFITHTLVINSKKHSMEPHCFWSIVKPPALRDLPSIYFSILPSSTLHRLLLDPAIWSYLEFLSCSPAFHHFVPHSYWLDTLSSPFSVSSHPTQIPLISRPLNPQCSCPSP